MCRLFGQLTAGSSTSAKFLVDSEISLFRQSHVDPEHSQDDGWGIGWYHGRDPVVRKGSYGAFRPEEAPEFHRAAHAAGGSLVLAHLRKASNPMNLPPADLHGVNNSQPFWHGTRMFIHNGMIPLPRETRARLGNFANVPKGVNDSEVLFYLILHEMEQHSNPLAAYEHAIEDLRAVWAEQGTPGKAPFSGLNVVLAPSADELWTFCFYAGEHGKALSGIDRPYYEMCYQEEGQGVVVGSEPFDRNLTSWKSLPSGSFLHASLSHGKVSVETGRIHA